MVADAPTVGSNNTSWNISPSMKLTSPSISRRTREVGGDTLQKSRGRKASRSRSRSVTTRQQEQLSKSAAAGNVARKSPKSSSKESGEKPRGRKQRSTSRSMQSSSHSTLTSTSRPSTTSSSSKKKHSRRHSISTAVKPKHHASLSALSSSDFLGDPVPKSSQHSRDSSQNNTGFHLPASLQPLRSSRTVTATASGDSFANDSMEVRPSKSRPKRMSSGDRFNQSLSSLRADRERSRSASRSVSRSRKANGNASMSRLSSSSSHTTQSHAAALSRRTATRERLREGRSKSRDRAKTGASFPRNPSRSRSRTPGDRGLDDRSSNHYQLRLERNRSVKKLLKDDSGGSGSTEDMSMNASATGNSPSSARTRLSSSSGCMSLRESRRKNLEMSKNNNAELNASSTHSTSSNRRRSSGDHKSKNAQLSSASDHIQRKTSEDTANKVKELLRGTGGHKRRLSGDRRKNNTLTSMSDHNQSTGRLSSGSRMNKAPLMKAASHRNLYRQNSPGNDMDDIDCDHHQPDIPSGKLKGRLASSREAAHLYLHASASEVLATSFGELCARADKNDDGNDTDMSTCSSSPSMFLVDSPVPRPKNTITTPQQRRLNASLNADMFFQHHSDGLSIVTDMAVARSSPSINGRSSAGSSTLSKSRTPPPSSIGSNHRRSSIPTFKTSGLDNLDDDLDNDDDSIGEFALENPNDKEAPMTPQQFHGSNSEINYIIDSKNVFGEAVTSDFSIPVRSMLGDSFGHLTISDDDNDDDLNIDIIQLVEEENNDAYDNMGNSKKLEHMASSFSSLDCTSSFTPPAEEPEFVDLTMVKNNNKNKSVSSNRTVSTRSSISSCRLASPLSSHGFIVRPIIESPQPQPVSRQKLTQERSTSIADASYSKSPSIATSESAKRKSSSRKSSAKDVPESSDKKKSSSRSSKSKGTSMKDVSAPASLSSSRRLSVSSKSTSVAPPSTRRRRASTTAALPPRKVSSSSSSSRRRSGSKKSSSESSRKSSKFKSASLQEAKVMDSSSKSKSLRRSTSNIPKNDGTGTSVPSIRQAIESDLVKKATPGSTKKCSSSSRRSVSSSMSHASSAASSILTGQSRTSTFPKNESRAGLPPLSILASN